MGAAVLLLLPGGVPDVVADGVEGGVTVLERDTLGEVEGLAPAVSDAVALLDTVLLPLRVLLAVPLGDVVGDGVLLPVGLADGVAAALMLPDKEMLAVFEGLAPAVSDAVGEALSVELAEMDEEGVGSAVPLLLPVGVPEEVAEGVEAGVALLVRDSLGVLDELAPAERDAVGVALSVELAD